MFLFGYLWDPIFVKQGANADKKMAISSAMPRICEEGRHEELPLKMGEDERNAKPANQGGQKERIGPTTTSTLSKGRRLLQGGRIGRTF